jgi:outer membrane protein
MYRFFLILALLTGSVLSTNAQSVDTLTLEQAVDQALEENLELLQAEYTTAQQAAALGEERLSLLPRPDVSIYSSRRYGLSFDQTAGRLTQTTTDYMSAGVGASLTLFDGFRQVASLREAGLQAEAAGRSEEWTRQTVIAETLRRFLQVLLAREEVMIRTADLEAQRQLLTQVEELAEVGRVPAADRFQQQEAIAASESQLLSAEHELRMARLQLAQTLGGSSADRLRVKAPAIERATIEPKDYDTGRLTRQALAERSDLQRQKLTVQAAAQNVRAARGSFWPRVSLSGSYGTSFSSAAGRFGFEEQLDRNRGGSVGLSLSFPLTGWMTGRRQTERAKIAERSAQVQARQAEQHAIRQVREAHQTLEHLSQQIEVTERRLRHAETALEGAEERYRLGRATIIELAQTRARYVDAERQHLQTRYRLFFQEKFVEYQTGQLTTSRSSGIYP